MTMPKIEIIVGTYSEYLVGYQLVQKLDKNGEEHMQLKQTFADKSHTGPIKCLAVQGQWVVSGGSDDRIFIYDMRTRKQSHMIDSHSSTINSVAFTPNLTHLLTGSADGRLIVSRVGSWKPEGDWSNSHDGKAVTHIACHPSSRMALTLGSNQILNTWNLVKGRVAYKTNLRNKRNLGAEPDCLSWSTEGSYFSLAGPSTLEIWDIKAGSAMCELKMPSRPICVAWVNDQNCVIGLANGSIAWISLDTETNPTPVMHEAHSSRVKAVCYLNETLVSISSEGEIKAWRCNVVDKDLDLCASINIGCRPTCLGVLDMSPFGEIPVKQPIPKAPLQPASSQPDDEQSESDPEPMRPRSFVSIEYEQETESKSKKLNPGKKRTGHKSNEKKKKKVKRDVD